MTISQHQVTLASTDIYGKQVCYQAYNASGKGRKVATIAGPVEICQLGPGCDGGRLDDGDYALRDVLAFAQRGEHGLSVVED